MDKIMRRSKQLLSNEECIEILKRGTSGVLAIEVENGYPYAVPISYVYDDNKIYFHGAGEGKKIEALKKNNMVSFCVIDKDQIVPEKFTTFFKSVIVYGKVNIVNNQSTKLNAIRTLATKYSPKETIESRDKEINSSMNALTILEMNIDYITGKQAIELVNSNIKKA